MEHTRFLCKYNRRVDILDISEIMYVERMERKNRIGTQEKERYCSGSLAQIRQALGGQHFVELNRSVSVNVNYIRMIREDCVEMRDGELFYIAKKKYKKILDEITWRIAGYENPT